MRNMFIRKFGFVVGGALLVLGLALALIGWGMTTLWAPPTSLEVKAPQPSVRALLIPPSIAGAGGAPPTISVTPPSGGRAGIAKVRSDQAAAWLDGLAHTKLTDFSEDSTSFTVESVQGDASIDPAQLLEADVTSESWLGDRDKPLAHAVVLDGRWSYIVVVKDSDQGPGDVTLTWAVGMESGASTPFIVLGGVLAVIGAVVLALAFRMRAANNVVPEEISPWSAGGQSTPTATTAPDGAEQSPVWKQLKDRALTMASSLPVIGPKISGSTTDDDYSFFDPKKGKSDHRDPVAAPATNSIPTTPPLTGAPALDVPLPGRPPAEPRVAPPSRAVPMETSQYGPATGVTPTYQPNPGSAPTPSPATGAQPTNQHPAVAPAVAPTPNTPGTTPATHDGQAAMPWASPAPQTPPPSAVPMSPQQAAAHFPPTGMLGAQQVQPNQEPSSSGQENVQHHLDSAETAAQEAVSALPESPRRQAKREREQRAQREGKTQ